MTNIAFIDVDGVVADLHTAWLYKYNKEFSDTLKVSDITSWGCLKEIVKPEAKDKIYSYIEDKNIYDYVRPILGSENGIRKLRENHFRVVFITTPSPNTYGIKLKWLISWKFLDDIFSKDYIETRDKSLVDGQCMVDDRPDNLINFMGDKILFDRPWNKDCTIEGIERVSGWLKTVDLLKYKAEYDF